MPEARTGSAVAVVSGKVYVMGGNKCCSNYVYDPASNTWSQRANLPNGGTYDGGAAVVLMSEEAARAHGASPLA